MPIKQILATVLAMLIIIEGFYLHMFYSELKMQEEDSTQVKESSNNQVLTSYSAEQKIKQYLALLNKNPNDTEALYNIAVIYIYEKRQPKQSIPYLQKILKINPNHSRKKEISLWIESFSKSHRSSIKNDPINKEMVKLRKEITKNPKNPYINIKLAKLYLSQGWINTAINLAKKAALLAPNDAEVYYQTGLLLKKDANGVSLAAFQRVLQLQESHPKKEQIQGFIKELQNQIVHQKETKADLEQLQKALFSGNPVAKRKALYQSEKLKEDGAIDILLDFLQQAQKRKERVRAAIIVKGINTPYGNVKLRQMLFDNTISKDTKEIILAAYRRKGNHKDIDLLTKWLADPSSKRLQRLGKRVLEYLKNQ